MTKLEHKQYQKEYAKKYQQLPLYKEYRKKRRLSSQHREERREYVREKLTTDPVFKLEFYLRVRLRKALRAKFWQKTTAFTDSLGCAPTFLQKHLEKQFQPGMSWSNHGEWHIDHIAPLCSAKTVEELYALCHYTNLQPLWAEDNIKKGSNL